MSKARFLPAKWNIMNFLMCREMDNIIRAFSRPLKWVSKLLCLPETICSNAVYFNQDIKWKSQTIRSFHILILRFASFQWNLHHGSKLHIKLLQNRLFFKKTNWQVMATHLMYLWFRKTGVSIRGQTIPRIQIAIQILHDFFSSY